MAVTVNSWLEGKCWIAFAGGGVAVLVGGTAVGVAVGGMGVDVGVAAKVGGRLVGTLVLAAGTPGVTQPASDKVIKLNKIGKDSFLIIACSFDQSALIITRRVYVRCCWLNMI